MPKDLAEADLTYYQVTYNSGRDTNNASVRAAYIVNDEKHPGWVVFKDHEHQVVAQFNSGVVVSVERGDPVTSKAARQVA